MKSLRLTANVTGLLLIVTGVCKAFNPTSFGPPTVYSRCLLGSTKNQILKKPFPPSHGWRGQQKRPALQMVATTAAAVKEKEGEASGESLSSKLFKTYVSTMRKATNLFPLWTILFSAIALKRPHSFDWFTTIYFTEALEILVLSMGLTLTPADFFNVLKRPKAVILQFFNCYAIMPLLAYALGMGFGLDPALLAGMVLVGSINGAQASNLCTFIAKGNVALSVVMTTLSTVGTIFMTPLLCKGLLGAIVPVDAYGIARSTVTVVLAPLAVGMTLKKYVPNFVKLILPLAPLVGVFATCLLVSSAVAQVADSILGAGLSLQLPVILLHVIGGIIGYFIPKGLGFDEVECRTIAIQNAMKSSAFGFLLAKLHFGQYAVRVPSAVSLVWMALTGSIMAVMWRCFPIDPQQDDH